MTAGDALIFAAFPVLLVFSGLFSGSETALFGLTYADRQRLARWRPASARAVSRLLSDKRALLITVLVLNMTVNTVYLALASALLVGAESKTLGAALNIGLLAALVLFGEVLAKMIAAGDRTRFCAVVAIPLLALHRAIRPVRVALGPGIVSPLVRLIRPTAPRGGSLSVEDLSTLVGHTAGEGGLERPEQRLLDRIVGLRSVRVSDVMTPRVGAPWVDAGADASELMAAIEQWPDEPIIVCDGSIDRAVLGVLDKGALLSALAAEYSRGREAGPDRRASDYLRAPVYAPETARLDQLLSQLRDRGAESAIAVDEHGGVVGVVRIEQAAAWLAPAADPAATTGEPSIQMVALGAWHVRGDTPVPALAEWFGLRFAGATARTVGGVIAERLGRIPAEGDEVISGAFRLRVVGTPDREPAVVEISMRDPSGESRGAP